jgi:glycosyltransferase involved in cell wall biosynthesis
MILDNAFRPDQRVLKEIKTLNALNCKVFLFCWDHDSDLQAEEKREGLEIYRIKIKAAKQIGLSKIKYLLFFYRCFLKTYSTKIETMDIIYVHDFLLLPLGVFLKFKLKKKLIYDAHEIYHIMEWEKYPAILRTLIFFMERTLIKFADHFIVVSDHRKKFYSKYMKKEINVIGNWYDQYNGRKKDLRKIYSLNADQILLGYFGTINFKVRPINKLIELVHNSRNIHFFIGGVGSDVDTLNEFIKSKNNVHYLGWLENVREYVDSLDYVIYVMNRERKYSEYTAPNTIYLAISHKKPIITNVPGEPLELIEKYNVGYYIKNLDDYVIDNLELKNNY